MCKKRLFLPHTSDGNAVFGRNLQVKRDFSDTDQL